MQKFLIFAACLLMAMACTAKKDMKISIGVNQDVYGGLMGDITNRLEGIPGGWDVYYVYDAKPMRYGRENGEPVYIFPEGHEISLPDGTTAIRIKRSGNIDFKEARIILLWYEEAVEDIEVQDGGKYEIDKNIHFQFEKK